MVVRAAARTNPVQTGLGGLHVLRKVLVRISVQLPVKQTWYRSVCAHLLKRKAPRRERSPLRQRNSAELRLGLEILSAVSSAAAAAAPKLAAAHGSERLVDVAPAPLALAKRTARRRAANAAAASPKPSLASSCTAFSLSQHGPTPVSPFADAGMQACEASPPCARETPRAGVVKAEAGVEPAADDRVSKPGEPGRGGDGAATTGAAGGPGVCAPAVEVGGPGASAGGPAAKRGTQAGEMPPAEVAALLARLGVGDAQVSYACECNVQARDALCLGAALPVL